MIISTDYYLDPCLRRRICSTITLVLPHIYNTALMMLQEQDGDVGRAQWNENEVAKLVDYLHEHRAQRGDAGNFKDPTYNAAAEYIQPFRMTGPVKTGKMVRTKWAWVSQFLIDSLRSLYKVA